MYLYKGILASHYNANNIYECLLIQKP